MKRENDNEDSKYNREIEKHDFDLPYGKRMGNQMLQICLSKITHLLCQLWR